MQSARRGVPDDRVDQVRGRLDAVLVAARVAPDDGADRARAGGDDDPHRALSHLQGHRHARLREQRAGRRAGPGVGDPRSRPSSSGGGPSRICSPSTTTPTIDAGRWPTCFDEAADFVEVIRRLWDSWEDDAEIRDVATGRFVDRDKLHYIDFEGRWFKVKGPSITPRPPQGQPVVTALAHATVPYRLAARSADAVFVTPHDLAGVRRIEAEVRAEEAADGPGGPSRCGSSWTWWCSSTTEPGAAAAGGPTSTGSTAERYRSDAFIFAGTPERAGRPTGGLAHPGARRLPPAPGVLARTTSKRSPGGWCPMLQRRGVVRTRTTKTRRCAAGSVSARPANRYVST